MLQDVNTGIAWVLNNAHLYGGDPDKTYIVGQSAGGHLGGLAMLAQVALAVERRTGESSDSAGAPGTADPGPDSTTTLNELGSLPPALAATPRWDPFRVRGFVGVSGAYNLVTLADHLDARGLNRRMFGAIMAVAGTPALAALSPTVFAQRLTPAAAAAAPPVLLLHGTADASVPVDNALDFARVLDAAGAGVKLRLYRDKTHTQPIVEDPMRGGRDELMDDVLELVRAPWGRKPGGRGCEGLIGLCSCSTGGGRQLGGPTVQGLGSGRSVGGRRSGTRRAGSEHCRGPPVPAMR